MSTTHPPELCHFCELGYPVAVVRESRHPITRELISADLMCEECAALGKAIEARELELERRTRATRAAAAARRSASSYAASERARTIS